MKRIILLMALIVTTTSYKEPQKVEKFDYSIELQEIRNNLKEAQQDLDIASEIVKDEKTLKKLRRKYKD